jgi:hypothetical protein
VEARVTPDAGRQAFLVLVTSGFFACDTAAPQSDDEPGVDGLFASEGEDDVDLEPVAESEDASDGTDDPPLPASVDVTSTPRPFAVPTCLTVSDTDTFSGPGVKVNTSPSCAAGGEMVSGGCNIDGGHVGHARLFDQYPSGTATWRCSAMHISPDNGFDIEAFATCCQ